MPVVRSSSVEDISRNRFAPDTDVFEIMLKALYYVPADLCWYGVINMVVKCG
jgi:hypothetical protein